MSEFCSGFACLVGRPNVGKSTLLNAILGHPVAITSPRPQTTRHAVRGIVDLPDAQIVLVDTPGLHRPRTLLGERLNDVVRTTWAEVDAVAMCVPADQSVGPGDRYLAGELAGLRRPILALVTKADLVAKDALAQRLSQVAALGVEAGIDWAEVVPVSARSGYQVDLVRDLLASRMPPGPRLYPEGELTDEPEHVLVAEIIREAALDGLSDELPHSVAVVVDELALRADRPEDAPLMDVHARLFVERPSQKAIIIGAGGSGLKRIGTAARQRIEALLGTPVYLDLHVTVARNWQRDPQQLRRLGF